MRHSIPLLITLAMLLQARPSDACCLTDWLRGRNTGYAVGYAPYSAAYAPVATTPYAAGYAPVVPTTYAAPYGVDPTGSTVMTARPRVSAPAAVSGVYQAQRPTYFDNPSVYTGLPVTSNAQTSYRVPVASTLRGTTPTATVYRSAYASGYPGTVSASQPVTVGTGTAVATPVAPVFPTAPAPRRCGLGRFCDGLFGTSYTTSYYRAPVTYYRPVTSIDPVSGTPVTVQQPCTSYVQQIQRSPASGIQVGQPAMPLSTTYPAPGAGSCGTSPYAASPATQLGPQAQSAPTSQVSPYAAPPASGVGQVGATGSYGQSVPIPSTAPPTAGGYYGQPGYAPNVAPLTGSPSPSVQPSDRSPVDQPQLNNGPTPAAPPLESTKPSSDFDTPRSYWQLQDAENSTAMIRSNPRASGWNDAAATSSRSDYTSVEPIQAPDDYVSPFRRSIPAPATAPVIGQSIETPPLPPRSENASDMTSASVRSRVPARSAALQRVGTHVQRQPVERQRDSTWFTPGP